MKILSHLFKKSKQSDGFKFENQLENDVRKIVSSWADEVVREFFGSLEERWAWHRKLSAGHFLSLRHIRDQLPQELVDSYDMFQEQVDKHLNPIKAKMALEEEERRKEEEEERKYAKNTVEDLTRLCIKVDAPVELVRKAVKLVGFTNHMGRPRPISLLTALEDADIVKWYAGVGRRKARIDQREAMKHYTKDLKIFDMSGNEEVYFPTEREVKMMGDRNLSDPKLVDGAISLALIRLASDEPPYSCVAHFCERTDTIVYRVRLLQKHLKVNPLDNDKWVKGMGAIHGSLNRKCLPLCPDHIHDFYMGRITFQDIDCASFVDVAVVGRAPHCGDGESTYLIQAPIKTSSYLVFMTIETIYITNAVVDRWQGHS
ncbi:hypothetical protein F8388_019597 [Cannabis sativa]|uniref:Domain X domain-containing protein n=1 Tax=Cannabis sativa TaxID=3483 RepID=A0A7J6FFB2_CANSA|nr:hypothetical protein F8388_019597 [Cannabis sativa]